MDFRYKLNIKYKIGIDKCEYSGWNKLLDEYGKIFIFYWELIEITRSRFYNWSFDLSKKNEYNSLI